jgi:tRNA (cmo5U34)-methyltransferase
MGPKDTYFSQHLSTIPPFEFNREVTEVFDDMITRSVPIYEENQRFLIEWITKKATSKSLITDLGCSTGTLLIKIANACPEKNFTLLGLDASEDMIQKALEKKAKTQNKCEFKQANFLVDPLPLSDIFILHFTLQFLSFTEKKQLLQRLYQALKPGGTLWLSEKISTDDEELQQFLTTTYWDYKKAQGYSELEIQQKHLALQNVLRPLTLSQIQDLLLSVGFSLPVPFLQWGPFLGCIVKKPFYND